MYLELALNDTWRIGTMLVDEYFANDELFNSKLPKECFIHARRFVSVLKQIKRFSKTRGLLGKDSSRLDLLKTKGKLRKCLNKFSKILEGLSEWELYLREYNPLQDMPLTLKRLGGKWLRVPNVRGRQLPDLHPHCFPEKNQWNKWLENLDTSSSVIHQRVPLPGKNILDRLRLMDRIVRVSFLGVSLNSTEDALKLKINE
jgi:hypothetical protein